MKGRLVRVGSTILLGLLVGGVLGVLAIARREAREFVHPEREVLTETPGDYGLQYQNVTLATEDGLTLHGWYLPGTNGAAIIVQHGYGSSRQGMLTEAAMLNQHGYGVLLFDWRGHGESEGDLVTFGAYEIGDVHAAVNWLRTRPEVEPERIGALGDSMGAVALLYAAARIPDIKAVVAVSPFPSLADEVDIGVRERTGLPTFPFTPLIVWFAEQEAGASISSIDLTQDIGRISPRPTFLLHGGKDDQIPTDSGEVLFAAARQPKLYWFDPHVGHAAFMESYPEEYERRVVEFFHAALGLASEGRSLVSSPLLILRWPLSSPF